MKKSYLLVAAPLIILAALVVVGLALLREQTVTVLLANQVSTATAISSCPARPTRIPFPTPTPFTETPKPPTSAPPPTPGPPPPIETAVPVPTLIHPLETEEEILKIVLEADMRGAQWDDPWCLETPRLQPGRITIKLYPNASAYYGSSPDFGGGDPVWVVTITGEVFLPMPGFPGKARDAHYLIDQKTGQLIGMGTSGPP